MPRIDGTLVGTKATTSCTLPEVPRTVCTKPDFASAPIWAFIPKYHWLPFWLECNSGSHALSLFLVEVGAAIRVASTTVPVVNSKPRCVSRSLTTARICSDSLCFSRRWRNPRMVLSSGRRANSSSWQTHGKAGCERRPLPCPGLTG